MNILSHQVDSKPAKQVLFCAIGSLQQLSRSVFFPSNKGISTVRTFLKL